MSPDNDRKRRPRPARTAPIRNASTLFHDGSGRARHDARASDGRGSGGNSGADPFGDAVSQSVKLGYSVVEDQIRRGRQAAQQMGRRGSAGFVPGAGDMSELGQRVLGFSTDLGALYMELVDMMMRLPQGGERARDDAAHAGGARPRTAAAGAGIAIDVEASGRSRVTLDLKDWVPSAELRVPALYSLDGGNAPLTDVRFQSGEPVTLRIRVPGDQPPGTYTGAIVDAKTNEPRGTLSVRLSQP